MERLPVGAHGGGRNLVYPCVTGEGREAMLRLSFLNDRGREELLAELEFVNFAAKGGGADAGGSVRVAGVLPSKEQKLLEELAVGGTTFYAALFERAKGKTLAENGYRYREGAPLSEYHYNCGRALGRLHRLSKEFRPTFRRRDFFEVFRPERLDALFLPAFPLFREKCGALLSRLAALDRDPGSWGLLHFDFNDGNYRVDFETGAITVYDFDNACAGPYLYDLADLWKNGTGWFRSEADPAERKRLMGEYFQTALAGYRAETGLSDEALAALPLLIDATLLEAVADGFESAAREGEEPDEELFGLMNCIEHDIPYMGFF